MKHESTEEDRKIIEFLAPLTENTNPPDNYGTTTIYYAAMNGHTEIVKILAQARFVSWLALHKVSQHFV